MPKARPDTATTYKEHFQDWSARPNVQKVRPRTTPHNCLKPVEDPRCPNAEYWSQVKSPCENRQIEVKRSKKCLHLHIHNNYEVKIDNLPSDKVGDIVNSYINGRMKAEGKPSLVVKKSIARFNVGGHGNKCNYEKQVPKCGKLSEPTKACYAKVQPQKVSCLCGGHRKPAVPALCLCPRQNE